MKSIIILPLQEYEDLKSKALEGERLQSLLQNPSIEEVSLHYCDTGRYTIYWKGEKLVEVPEEKINDCRVRHELAKHRHIPFYRNPEPMKPLDELVPAYQSDTQRCRSARNRRRYVRRRAMVRWIIKTFRLYRHGTW